VYVSDLISIAVCVYHGLLIIELVFAQYHVTLTCKHAVDKQRGISVAVMTTELQID
jgi:hypothetical protein